MFAHEHDFDSAVQAAALDTGVEPALLKAVIGHESQFNPAATRQEPAIGDQSVGLMQVLYATAQAHGYQGPVGSPSNLTGLYDPPTNILYGARELASRLAQTSSVASAVSAYNGGYRPALGFGKPAMTPLTVCLARDQVTGKCIQTRNVNPGEYANQPYVDDVLRLLTYFRQSGQSPPADSSAAPLTAPHTAGPGGWIIGGVVVLLGALAFLFRRSK